MKHKTQKMTQT